MNSGCEAGWLLPALTGTQTTNYKAHTHTVSVRSRALVSLIARHISSIMRFTNCSIRQIAHFLCPFLSILAQFARQTT